MIPYVKLSTHRIGTYRYAISKCTFLLGFYLEMKQSFKNHQCGCEKGHGHKRGSSGVAYDDSYCANF